MPRLLQAVPKYRKHRASGQAVVTINGRDYYLGLHGSKASRAEHDRLISEWLASGRSLSYGSSAHEVTTVEIVVDYLKYAKDYYGTAASSEFHRLVPVLRILKEMYGRTSAASFGPLQFRAVQQKLIPMGWSRSYINANMRRITRMFRWAASEGMVSPTVPQALAMVPGLRQGKTTARETDPVLPVNDLDVALALTSLSEVVGDMVRVQRLTGMRPGEVCIMRPCDIERSGEVWFYRPASHKTQHRGKKRVIFIGPCAQAILLRYLARDSEMHFFRPCDAEAKRLAARRANRKTSLSCGKKPGSNRKRNPRKQPGERYTTTSYQQAIRKACLKAGINPWGPNRLRHSFATEVRKEHGLEATQPRYGAC